MSDTTTSICVKQIKYKLFGHVIFSKEIYVEENLAHQVERIVDAMNRIGH